MVVVNPRKRQDTYLGNAMTSFITDDYKSLLTISFNNLL